jgi:hypothetical protein
MVLFPFHVNDLGMLLPFDFFVKPFSLFVAMAG